MQLMHPSLCISTLGHSSRSYRGLTSPSLAIKSAGLYTTSEAGSATSAGGLIALRLRIGCANGLAAAMVQRT